MVGTYDRKKGDFVQEFNCRYTEHFRKNAISIELYTFLYFACNSSFTHTHTHTHTHTLLGGEVYSWGCGRRGRLGRDTNENVYEPQLVPFEHPSHTVQSVTSSHSVTLLLTTPGT